MGEHGLLWPEGLKKTKSREKVLCVLQQAKKPISATEIYKVLGQEEEGVWLSTVYRTLDCFVEKGMVLKTTVLDNEMALYEINHYGHRHYAVCLECHKVVAMDNCPLEKFVPHLDESDFDVMGHKIEMYGYCKNCKIREKEK